MKIEPLVDEADSEEKDSEKTEEKQKRNRRETDAQALSAGPFHAASLPNFPP